MGGSYRTCTMQATTHRILSAELKGALPAADDPTLFPSDHIAIKVSLEIDAIIDKDKGH